jgi:antitoxin (DNA-binding transcriptional repressor) of toxin-antitoxin stability system
VTLNHPLYLSGAAGKLDAGRKDQFQALFDEPVNRNRFREETHKPTVTLEEAQAQLPKLIEQLQPGEEMTITDHRQPLAHVKKADRSSWPCKADSYRKAEFWMAPDFDAPLDDFKDYME